MGIEPTYRTFRYGTTDLKSAEPTSGPCASGDVNKLSIGDISNQDFSLYKITSCTKIFGKIFSSLNSELSGNCQK